jgi:hypothetical protein
MTKEQLFFKAHFRELEKHYGKKRANNANIGWVQDDDAICSKVYGNPTMCVTTFMKKENGKYVHKHEQY